MTKIIIADNMEKEVIENLKALGEVKFQPSDLKSALSDADVLIVRSATKVTAELISSAPKLKIVARAGVGLDNVDVKACEAKKIKVINTPGASTNSVAELTICTMIGTMRKVGFLHSKMIEGKWEKKQGVGSEIFGKTLGIIGMGKIGQEVAKKASALGMNVIYFARSDKNFEYEFVPSLPALLSRADVISLHSSANKGDPPILGEKEFMQMKKGAYILNLARGSLIDEQALISALKSGQLAGAALDVYPTEPYEGELLLLQNVLLTPHVGASTLEAQLRIGDELIEQIKANI
ncbi:MAG: NAD(P)-dependent oxidoreductase [Candidatus Micrarchaeia archaeon]